MGPVYFFCQFISLLEIAFFQQKTLQNKQYVSLVRKAKKNIKYDHHGYIFLLSQIKIRMILIQLKFYVICYLML